MAITKTFWAGGDVPQNFWCFSLEKYCITHNEGITNIFGNDYSENFRNYIIEVLITASAKNFPERFHKGV